MTTEDLLKPRYKVIADYPNSIFGVDEIICPTVEVEKWGIAMSDKYYSNYPHLFKKLEWYEERKEEDLPGYLKKISKDIDAVKMGEIITIKDFKWWGFNRDSNTWKYFYPATKEEYENQKLQTT